MHVSLANFLTLAGVVSLLIVAAGIVGASFRVSRNTQTLANYREAALSWETKATSQEHEISDLQHQVKDLQDRSAEKDTQIVALQEQIQGLRDLLINRAAFETLEQRMSDVVAAIETNRSLGQQILAALTK